MKTSPLRQERERQRREDYRETILHAAESVILRKGFSATTMDDVAREAQFSKATLYKYFPSKSLLLAEILGHYFEEVGDGLDEIQARPVAARDKLRLAIAMILRYHQEKENITRVLWMDNSMLKLLHVFVAGPPRTSSASDRKMLGVLRQKRREVLERAARIMEEGIASGEFRKMDPLAAVTFIEAVLQGYAHTRFWLQDESKPQDSAEELSQFILQGIQRSEYAKKEK